MIIQVIESDFVEKQAKLLWQTQLFDPAEAKIVQVSMAREKKFLSRTIFFYSLTKKFFFFGLVSFHQVRPSGLIR